jgi:glycosyltransferase involved in cell wall biosynthesis
MTLKVAVLAAGDPLDVRTWSGIPYYMTRTLMSRFPDLVVIRDPQPSWRSLARRAIRRATGGRIELAWVKALARQDARRIATRLKGERVEVAVCIGTAPLSAYLSEHIPCIHVSDATYPLMSRYYREFSNLAPFLKRNAEELDGAAVRGSRACLYPTAWAAQSAIKDYDAEPSRVYVIPWGCNIDAADVPPWRVRPRDDKCRLVFIGLDWKRKGGDIVIDTLAQLLDFGCPTTLDIVGKTPDLSDRLAGLRQSGACEVVEHGFINKSVKEEMALFDSIMKRASFLFLPTRQDCYGLVFVEASAYGVPVIATDTGGVSGAVREGVNGYLLPPSAEAHQYAQLIWDTWSDESHYARLRLSSRRLFEDALNWQSWLASASKVIEGIGSC